MFRLVLIVTLFTLAQGNATGLNTSEGRIVNGENADIKDYPYQLSFQIFYIHLCGASIIGKKWALTAAHCTDSLSTAGLTVVAGMFHLDYSGGTQRLNVIDYHQHPAYNPRTFDNDISILELEYNLELMPNVQIIKLASDGSDVTDGTDAVVTGWGDLAENGDQSKQLQSLHIPIIGREKCAELFSAGRITENMICAGLIEGGKDACQGDSGGPLASDEKLVGVVSWGVGCARPRRPGIYARVGSLRSFIKKVTGI